VLGLLRYDDVALKVQAHFHGLPLWVAVPRQTPALSFMSPDTLVKPRASIRDFAWPSVKLLAPATERPGWAGCQVVTAGVFASRFAGGLGCWAMAGIAMAKMAAVKRSLRIIVPLFGGC
jgi:hypothetical protein